MQRKNQLLQLFWKPEVFCRYWIRIPCTFRFIFTMIIFFGLPYMAINYAGKYDFGGKCIINAIKSLACLIIWVWFFIMASESSGSDVYSSGDDEFL